MSLAPEQDRAVDYRELMKKVERVVEAIERADDPATTVHTVAETLIAQFREQLGIYGGRLYQRKGRHYVVLATLGDAHRPAKGVKVPVSYPATEALLAHGVLYMDAGDPLTDRSLEEALGVEKFAAIEVGDGKYVLAFDVAPGHDRTDILFSLGILRHSINQKIRQQRFEAVFREARKIQSSILPRRVPQYGAFDIAGRSEPVESVGGDYYDFIPVTDKILGLAIADVSGHGLPAALQVRDVYMGLRMGLARDFKIVRTVERLNEIINESTLTSRFVSLFYGELELNGVFIYVNAGHPPPFHLAADGAAHPLEDGGAVLGPVRGATYERGFVRLRPGDLIVFYTDGITEARGRGGDGWEEYGTDRLLEVMRGHRERPAAEVVDAAFASVAAFAPGRARDDRTVVVVRYPG